MRSRRYTVVPVATVLVLVLVAFGSTLQPDSSEAQPGSMHNCPAAGKWSIAVWEGQNGTAAATALATCGAGAVNAAYSLDPQTQAWSRWFAAKPEVSNLAPLKDMQGVLALASATAPVATETPSATQTPSATPTATPTGGYTLTFASAYWEAETFTGTVSEITMMESIPATDFYPSTAPPPGGEFAVVLMTVTNTGSEPADVGTLSFRLRDSQERVFTMDFPEWLSAQSAAEMYFVRAGAYDTVMPDITLEMVFVFLTPKGATGLAAEACPASGC
jgi:hypothetical protein